MNIFDRQNIDWESFAGELLWHNVVYHGDDYSGYDIIVNAGPNNVYSQLENPYPRGNKPGDIVRDTSFLSYYIGPVRKLSWKELCIALMFYKDILLPDHHDCPKCDDYKNCKARFKDDPKQERCNYWSQKYNTTTIYEEYKKFIDNLINFDLDRNPIIDTTKLSKKELKALLKTLNKSEKEFKELIDKCKR